MLYVYRKNMRMRTQINVLHLDYESRLQRCTGLARKGFVVLLLDNEIHSFTKEVCF